MTDGDMRDGVCGCTLEVMLRGPCLCGRHAPSLLLEDGGALLLEDGGRILLE